MTLSLRQLGPEDAPLLRLLASDDADFDIAGRGEPLQPLDPDAARAFLSDPGVWCWVAERGTTVVGFLYGHRLRKRAGDSAEFLLYEIGVRTDQRRQGVGRALVTALRGRMREHGLHEVWVLADNPGAEAFYRSCGFERGPGLATFLLAADSPGD